VFGVQPSLGRRWPAFHDLLVTQTPYRSLMALPLRAELTGLGSLCLYFGHPDGPLTVSAFDARAVADVISAHLGRTAAWATWTECDGPAWMSSPAAQQRARVWQAMGMVSLAFHLPAPDALAVLRAHAYGTGRDIDAVAADLVSGRLPVSRVEGAGSDV